MFQDKGAGERASSERSIDQSMEVKFEEFKKCQKDSLLIAFKLFSNSN
jgi:hypothetical protein